MNELRLGTMVSDSGRRLGAVGDILIFRADQLCKGCWVVDVTPWSNPCIRQVVSAETTGDDVVVVFTDGGSLTTSVGNEFVLVGTPEFGVVIK
jgi:hypothetical protein